MKYLNFGSFLVLSVGVCAAALNGCSSDAKDTTGGQRIVLATRVKPAATIADDFTSGTQWRVKLDSARLAVGGLYYFDGKPALALSDRRTLRQRLSDFFIGTAYAHPQHYVAGNALGEMVEPSSVDLFRGANLVDGNGITGTFRSGRIVLPDEVVGPAAEDLARHIATASGVATKAEKTVFFTISADLTDIQETSPKGEIDGCVFDEVEVTGDGTVTLTVTPQVWFNLVDFSDIVSGSASSPTDIVHGDVAHKAFSLGVAQLSAYHFEYTP
ncbi:MAG: putative lipoprotein [Polyangiaceae bacterium]|jgi:hypothetical protein|nr:putative lipoprotein [Polyangiaceae bacterium]